MTADPGPGHPALDAMAGAIMTLLDRYQALVDAGRIVDLDHVEESVATFCAHVLALPEPEGQRFLAPLATLLEKTDRLQVTLPPA